MHIPPLAEVYRPALFENVVGQDHLFTATSTITLSLQAKSPKSLILWGPPGCGKTTIARIYAKSFSNPSYGFSAVNAPISAIKSVVEESKNQPLLAPPIIFIDEIHRYNKMQQDLFLPYIENGACVVIGATTENPSFALNNALLSRLQVLPLKPLDGASLQTIVQRFENKNPNMNLSVKLKKYLVELAKGDGRYLFTLLDHLLACGKEILTEKDLSSMCALPSYDKKGDHHYNLISALHKSVRGSDVNAALYWLSRMLNGGEDPQFIARRLVRMAIEDIGLADPQAVNVALNCCQAFERLGSPEGELALAQATVYLALSPKSNRIYTAYKSAMQSAAQSSHLPPPSIIINAPTKMMKNMGFGKGYKYDHDTKNAFSGQNYLPKALEIKDFYEPAPRGFEREMQKRIDYFKKLKRLNAENEGESAPKQ